jgi:hypothetical protein
MCREQLKQSSLLLTVLGLLGSALWTSRLAHLLANTKPFFAWSLADERQVALVVLRRELHSAW